MATINYEVIGSPVTVSANCDDISVTICWTGRTIYDDECNDQYRDERICSAITITPGKTDITGSITWNGKTVNYTIKRDCPEPPKPNCTLKCSDMEAYTIPKFVTGDYKDDIEIHYKYYLTDEDDATNEVCSRVKKAGVDIIKLSDTEKFEGCDYSYKFVKEDDLPNCDGRICLVEKEDPCATGFSLYLTVSLSKTVIPPNLSDEEGNPVFDDDWKILPADECFDNEGNPVPVTDNPEESQCHATDGVMKDGELKKYPRYDENNKPIPYYTVYVSIVYKLVETDDNCNKITETGMLKYPWHIPPCENGCVITGKVNGRELPKTKTEGGEEAILVRGEGEVSFSVGTQKPTRETHPCCFARTIAGSTSISAIKEDLKARGKITNVEDIKSIFYNGIKTTKDEISYSVKMNPKKDGECAGVCEQTDKYGVVANTTRVCYETSYMSDKWMCEGSHSDDCGCDALTIYDRESGEIVSPYSVPFYGGRIKVEWDYVRHSVTDDCDEFYTYGTWEEVIMVGGCDERPTDCNVCYGHNTEDGECDICDAECCYDDIGGKCSLLFKEQFPEFWDDMLMCDNKKSKLTIYKCKKCGALTPVMSDADDCEPPIPKNDSGRQWCPSCEKVEDGILEPIVFDMSHEYVETPYYICPNDDCKANLQSPGIDENCEYIPPDKCPFCGQEWSYDESKPNSGVTSDWYNKVKYAFNQDCNKSCDYRKYETYDEHDIVEIPCSGGTYQEDIEYTETIEFIGEGCPENIVTRKIEKIDIEVEPNPNTFGRTIRSDKVITIIQNGCEEEKDGCGCGYLTTELK